MDEIKKKNMDRRAVIKGAAWSAPVIAAAVATPLAAATGDKWDVAVAGVCEGRFRLKAGMAQGLVDAALSALKALGYKPAKREFSITVKEGPLPNDTYFTLKHNGVLNLSLLSVSGILNATIIGIDALTAQIKIPAGTPQGSVLTLDLLNALADITLLSSATVTLNGSDNPTDTVNPGANSATVSTAVGSSVNVNVPFLGTYGYTLQVCN